MAGEQGAAEGAGEAAGLTGWWRSASVCLEIFDNGDFELSDPGDQPKVMIMGKATVTADGSEAVKLELATARIWKGRFTGPCRKVHELGGWIDARELLGKTFKKGEVSMLTLRRIDATQVELCGERCATLKRDTPVLGARWRRAGMEYPDRPERPWGAGDLLEVSIDQEGLGHVWAGAADGKRATVYGRVKARYVDADRFILSVTAERYADAVERGEPPVALGVSFPVGETRELAARRLAGEAIEVCAGERCVTLERQFDAYHHDLE